MITDTDHLLITVYIRPIDFSINIYQGIEEFFYVYNNMRVSAISIVIF